MQVSPITERLDTEDVLRAAEWWALLSPNDLPEPMSSGPDCDWSSTASTMEGQGGKVNLEASYVGSERCSGPWEHVPHVPNVPHVPHNVPNIWADFDDFRIF